VTAAGLGCREARPLLAATASGAAVEESARLRLEAHLAGCADCRVERRAVRAVAALGAWEPPALDPAARARVLNSLEGALAAAGAVPVRAVRGWRVAAMAAAAALLVAGGALLAWRVLGGGPGTGAGDPVTAGAPLVTPLEGGRVAWDAPRAARLLSGTALFEVPPGGGPFVVHAPRFDVHVVGTKFVVGMEEVRVLEGVVRVSTPEGAELALLHAGETWKPATVAAAATATPAATAAADGASPETGKAAPAATDAELLARARTFLRGKNGPAARAVLAELLARRLATDVAAEARTLRAEAYGIEARPEDAARAYEDVARRYPHTASGDNAKFAAARTRCDLAPASCGATMRAYLAAYPTGAFVAEANAALRDSGGAP